AQHQRLFVRCSQQYRRPDAAWNVRLAPLSPMLCIVCRPAS
ncbi:MAG: hypothetical protein ACI92Z_003525, partial [Paracoccaceae bacterium]